jgi:cytochrome c553
VAAVVFSAGVTRLQRAAMSCTAIVCLLLPFVALAEAAAGTEKAETEAKIQACFACHGPDGASTVSRYPILAGQEEYYLYVQLRDFQAGRRENAEMAPMVQGLTKEDMQAVAKFFSQQAWPNLQSRADPQTIKTGISAAAAGQCPQCHLGGYNGNSRVPRLAGQHADYLEKTMLDFKNKTRNNAPDKSALMRLFSDEDIEALAEYLGSLTVHGSSAGSEIGPAPPPAVSPPRAPAP